MAQLKYSRQRDMIRSYLSSTKEHPTADMVYENVRKEFPNISLGTVYRNLKLLVSEGEAIKIDCGDGCERFDSRVSPHYHFICRNCGRVLDIEMPSIAHIDTLAGSSFDGVIEGHSVYFYGRCGECKK